LVNITNFRSDLNCEVSDDLENKNTSPASATFARALVHPDDRQTGSVRRLSAGMSRDDIVIAVTD
jgi:hypothetical protein